MSPPCVARRQDRHLDATGSGNLHEFLARCWEPFAQSRAAQNARLRVHYPLTRIDAAEVLVEQLPPHRPPIPIVARAPQYPADHFDLARNRSCDFTLMPARRPHVQDDLGMTSGKGDNIGQFDMRSGSRHRRPAQALGDGSIMRPQCCFSGHEPTALYEEKADANAEYSRHGVTYVTCSELETVAQVVGAGYAASEITGNVAVIVK